MKDARTKILEEIKAIGGLKGTALPIKLDAIQYPDKKKQFMEAVQSVGGKTMEMTNEDALQDYLAKQSLDGKIGIKVGQQESLSHTKEELYAVDIAFIKGGIAVAENGAVWVTEKNMGSRILPFSCERLMIAIKLKDIVHNMHEAYELIDIAQDGYGLFISGPSKTADIEQSLVIGAHGPLSYLVFIIME